MYNFPRQCKYHMEEISERVLYTYIVIDRNVGCEQSWWMKGICLIWSRGRQFSPSLPDRGPTQGRGPTGIWNLAHSMSDPRAETSGILVMVRRSSTTSRGTTYWFWFFCFPSISSVHVQLLCLLSSKKKKKENAMKEWRTQQVRS